MSPDVPLDDHTRVRRRILLWARSERQRHGDLSVAGIVQMAMNAIGGPLTASSATVYRFGQSVESLRQELEEMLHKGAREGWL